MEKLVRVGKMPGRITEVVVDSTSTIADILDIAELDSTGFDIKVDGKVATLDTVIGDGNLVVLAAMVKGN